MYVSFLYLAASSAMVLLYNLWWVTRGAQLRFIFILTVKNASEVGAPASRTILLL